MCLAIPTRVLDLDPTTATATVTLGGVRRTISLALVDDVAVGDYVLVHVGYALNKLSVEEAEETLALIATVGALAEETPAPTDQRPATPTPSQAHGATGDLGP